MIMVTCGLHGNPVFRNGGLSNPNPEIRLLAAKKLLRTIRIGNFLGAEYLTHWVARDGFETRFAVPWERTYRYLTESLNPASRYALGMISLLETPSFWGVNPELLQHEGMTNLSASVPAAMAAHAGKLFHLHPGNQKPGQFDNHIVRSDTAPGTDNSTRIRMDFIRQNVENYRLAEKKAKDLAADADIGKWMAGLWDREPAAIAKAPVDYDKVNAAPLHIARLDTLVTRRLPGLG